jgi:hypothetical protein
VIASAIEHDFSAVDIDSLSFYQQQQQWDVVSPRGTKCDPAVYYDDPTAAKWSHCDYDLNEVFDNASTAFIFKNSPLNSSRLPTNCRSAC